MSIIQNITEKELRQIVKESKTITQALKKMGYERPQAKLWKIFREKCEILDIDYSHFTLKGNPANGRIKTHEEVFCENSEVSQNTLRRWFLKEDVEYQCSICGITEWNNKELTLRLDHIDGCNHNNQLSNLRWVCPNCDSQLDTYCGRNREKKIKFCKDCGVPISLDAERCPTCYQIASRVIERPTREELKNLIRTKSFVQIGKDYNVSDNAIRKWCDGYNLPRKKTEINNYSAEEWQNI